MTEEGEAGGYVTVRMRGDQAALAVIPASSFG